MKLCPSLSSSARAFTSTEAEEVPGVDVRGVIVGVLSSSSTVSLVSSASVVDRDMLGPEGSRRGGVWALGMGCISMGAGTAGPRLHRM